MNWCDATQLARCSIRRHLGRALVTVLAVALGTALLASLLIATGAAKKRVLAELGAGGSLAAIRVDTAAPTIDALDSDNPPLGAPRPIDDLARRRIASLSNVSSVVPVVVTPALVVPPARPTLAAQRADLGHDDTASAYVTSLVGIDLVHANGLPLTLVTGRLPAPSAHSEVAVTLGYLRHIGIDNEHAGAALGRTLLTGAPRSLANVPRTRPLWTNRTIVGVVSQEAGDGDVLTSLAEAQRARDWTLASTGPIPAAGFTGLWSPYTALYVDAAGLDHVTDVRAAINRVGYSTAAPETVITQVQRYSRVVEIILAGIGLIGLAIAGLGITTAMLAALRERQREIGVLKAVGATDRDIRRVFLVEAGGLGLLGGTTGASAALLIANGLAHVVNGYLHSQHLRPVQLDPPFTLLAAVVLSSTIVALLAGWLPAARAAHLPPRRAMGDP